MLQNRIQIGIRKEHEVPFSTYRPCGHFKLPTGMYTHTQRSFRSGN